MVRPTPWIWHIDFHVLSNISQGKVPVWEQTAESAFCLGSHLAPPVSCHRHLSISSFRFLPSQLPCLLLLLPHFAPLSPYSLIALSVLSVFCLLYATRLCRDQSMLKPKDVLGKSLLLSFHKPVFSPVQTTYLLKQEIPKRYTLLCNCQSSHGLDDPCLTYLNFLKSCTSKWPLWVPDWCWLSQLSPGEVDERKWLLIWESRLSAPDPSNRNSWLKMSLPVKTVLLWLGPAWQGAWRSLVTITYPAHFLFWMALVLLLCFCCSKPEAPRALPGMRQPQGICVLAFPTPCFPGLSQLPVILCGSRRDNSKQSGDLEY